MQVFPSCLESHLAKCLEGICDTRLEKACSCLKVILGFFVTVDKLSLCPWSHFGSLLTLQKIHYCLLHLEMKTYTVI